jgi:A/G-specific adenine glycosylase
MSIPYLPQDSILFFQKSIIDFFLHHARVLPWRHQRSIYHTLVSEMMLQQTQVKTVVPYFQRWIYHFPSLEILAQADEASILKLWEGLGYYKRAQSLHEIAKTIYRQGYIPKTPDEWKKLPGIGSYTAAAIASLAQDVSVVVIDGNVIRVLARFWNINHLFDTKEASLKYLKSIAEQCFDSSHHALYNEGIMEFGATLCLPKNPRCLSCPLSSHCQAHIHGNVQGIPRFKITTYRNVCKARGIFSRKDEIWLSPMNHQTHTTSPIWEFPEISLSNRDTMRPIFTGKRSIGHTHFIEKFYVLAFLAEIAISLHGQWFLLETLNHITMSGPHRKWLSKLQLASSSSFKEL